MNTFAMDFHAKPDWEAGSGCHSDPYIGWKWGFIYIKFLLLMQRAGKSNTTDCPASWPLSDLLS